MMREIKKYRYVFAAVLTILIFTLGVLFSNLMDGARYSSLQKEIQQDNIEIESRQLQLSYLRSDNFETCRGLEAGLQDVVDSYNNRLDNIENYEETSFFRSDDFESMKKLYILSGLRYWMFADELKKQCDYDVDTILYFTTQIGAADNCEACGYTGEQLSLLKQQYGEDLLVFTVPTEFENSFVDILQSQYNVTEIPTVIVNENTNKSLEGRASIEDIENLLKSDGEN